MWPDRHKPDFGIERVVVREPDDTSELSVVEAGFLDYNTNPLWEILIRGYEFQGRSLDVIATVEKGKRPDLFMYANFSIYMFYTDDKKSVIPRSPRVPSAGIYLSRADGYQELFQEFMAKRPKGFQNYDAQRFRIEEDFAKERLTYFMDQSGYAYMRTIPRKLHHFIHFDARKAPEPQEFFVDRLGLVNYWRASQIQIETLRSVRI